MSILLFVIRWIVLLLLLGGTCSYVRRKLCLKLCFSPIVTISTITVATFWGGLMGDIQPVTYSLILLCLGCTLLDVRYRIQHPVVWNGLPIVEVGFLLGIFFFGLILSQSSLVHYDNFTHWGLVVKEMLITHSFPAADSALIEFTNYPTGMASWIYFVCTVVGNGENSMVMAQGMLIFSAIYAIFGIIQERGRFLLLATLGAGLSTLSLFNYSIRINNLLVDFVLPVLTLTAIALIYRHRREPNTIFITVVPVVALLVVVKSTGVIFASIALIYMVYVLAKYSPHHDTNSLVYWGKGVLATTLGILPIFLWNRRVDRIFSDVSHKFETDITQVGIGYGGKTQEEIDQICKLFWETITDITQRSTMGMIFFQVIAMVACIVGCIYLKKRWVLPKVLMAMDLAVIIYLLGILAMYIFSMPMDEAIYLAAFDRYSSSIVVLFGGVLSICFTVDMENSFHYRLGEIDEERAFQSVQSKKIYLRSCVACVIIIAVVLISEYNGMSHQEMMNNDVLCHEVRAVVGDNWSREMDESKYLLFASDEDGLVTNYYLHYVARYYLRAPSVDAICLFYEDNFLNLLSQYDYLVVVEPSNHEKGLMEKYFGLSGEAGIYDLSALRSSSMTK